MWLLLALAAGVARADDPPDPQAAAAASPDPASGAGDDSSLSTEHLKAFEARLTALEAALQAEREAAFLREAEALAAAPPPPPPQPGRAAFNALNPGITAFGDLVGQLGVDGDGVRPGSTVYLRSLELQLRADVDPFAKADAVIAFEQEAPDLDGGAGEGFEVGPEEVYLELVALPWRLSGKVGKFKAPFGIINRIHPHDLPWVDAPPAQELVAEEGYNDAGATLAGIVPLGPVALTLTGGLFAGEPFDPDNERANAAALGRAELFGGFGSVDVAVGGSAIFDVGGAQQVGGVDLTFRYRPSQRRSLFLMAEGFRGAGGDPGGYAAVQVQPLRSFYLGFREDIADGVLTHNLSLSTCTSEFLRVRVGGGFAPATGEATALGQLTFVWGSHPVEPWWVNR